MYGAYCEISYRAIPSWPLILAALSLVCCVRRIVSTVLVERIGTDIGNKRVMNCYS